MYLFRQPDDQAIHSFTDAQSRLDFTYSHVGGTRDEIHPAGFAVDHNRIRLGTGEATYRAAKQALLDWRHYRFDWIDLYRPDAPPEPGQTVAVLARALGLWVLNACRIVYVLEEEQPVHRFAFAYGTLPEHAESGEERFQIEWRPSDDSVWYDIYAFSRPNQFLSRVAYPYVRMKQKQFASESKLAMAEELEIDASQL